MNLLLKRIEFNELFGLISLPSFCEFFAWTENLLFSVGKKLEVMMLRIFKPSLVRVKGVDQLEFLATQDYFHIRIWFLEFFKDIIVINIYFFDFNY